jgi:hypothetical protein
VKPTKLHRRLLVIYRVPYDSLQAICQMSSRNHREVLDASRTTSTSPLSRPATRRSTRTSLFSPAPRHTTARPTRPTKAAHVTLAAESAHAASAHAPTPIFTTAATHARTSAAHAIPPSSKITHGRHTTHTTHTTAASSAPRSYAAVVHRHRHRSLHLLHFGLPLPFVHAPRYLGLLLRCGRHVPVASVAAA